MSVGESSPTLERVNLLLTPNAIDYALESGVTSIVPHPEQLDSFFRGQIDSQFDSTELTIIMRCRKDGRRLTDGGMPVYGDIQRLPQQELDYVSRRDIDPATAVEMEVDQWTNYSLGFQLLRGAAREERRSLEVIRDKRTLLLGDYAAYQFFVGLVAGNEVSFAFNLALASATAAYAVRLRKKDQIYVRASDISAPIARYYQNFTVTQVDSEPDA